MPAGIGGGTVIGSAWLNLGIKTTGQKDVKGMGSSLGALGLAAGGAHKQLVKLFGAYVGAAALAGAVKKSTQAFIEFDRQLRNTHTLITATENELQDIGKEVRLMARNFQTSAAESQAALYQIYSATIYGGNAMVVLEESTKGAAAGLSDLMQTADMVTTVLNAYGMAASESAHINDLLFTTVRYGKVTYSELADQFGRLAGVAAPTGASVSDMTAAIATLTRQGIAADWAVTSLRQTLMQFIKPTKNLKTALKDLGFESGSLMIKQYGFAEALKLITKWAKENNVEMDQMFTNVRAVTAILPLTTTAAAAYALDQQRMADSAGAASIAFEKQTKSISFQIKKFKTLFNDFAISLGKVFIPALMGAVKAIEAITTPLRKAIEIFDFIGGDYFIAIAATIGTLTLAFWGLAKALTVVSAAMTMGAIGASNMGAKLGALLYGAGKGSMLLGAGKLFGGGLAAGLAVQEVLNLDLKLGEVTGLESVRQGAWSAVKAVLGGAIAGALFGVGAIPGAIVATAGVTIKILHEVIVRRGEEVAAAEEAVRAGFTIRDLPTELAGGAGINVLAKRLVEANDELENTQDNFQAMIKVLREFYDPIEGWHGLVTGWALDMESIGSDLLDFVFTVGRFGEAAKEAGEGVAEGLADLSIAGIERTEQTIAGLPLLNIFVAEMENVSTQFAVAKDRWAELKEELKSQNLTTEQAKEKWQELGGMASEWSLIATIATQSGWDLAGAVTAVSDAWTKWVEENKDAVNPITASVNSFYESLDSLIEAFIGSEKGTLTNILATKGLGEALAELKEYVGDLRREGETASPAISALIMVLEALGITMNNVQSAVDVFNNAIASVSTTLSSVASQISATFATLQASIMEMETLGERMAGVSALMGASGNIQSYREFLERAITGAGYDPEYVQWAKEEWERIKGEPTPGQTYAEIARDQEQAAKEAQAAAKKAASDAASAAKQAAREAEQAAKDAAAAAQEAFREQFRKPILEGIKTGDWGAAAKTIIAFAQSRDAITDLANSLSTANDVVIDEIEVIGLILGAQSELLSAMDNQIQLLQLAGEDTLALEAMKQGIEDLLDPLGGFKKKLREILGIMTPKIAATEIRYLAELLRGKGGIGFQHGGFVGGSGGADTIPAMLSPGEFVVPKWMMKIPGLSSLIFGIWGKKFAEGGPASQSDVLANNMFKELGVSYECVGGVCREIEDAAEEFTSSCGKCAQTAQEQSVATEQAANKVVSSFEDIITGIDIGKMAMQDFAENILFLQDAIKSEERTTQEMQLAQDKLNEMFTGVIDTAEQYISNIENQISAYELLGWNTDELTKKLIEAQAGIQDIPIGLIEFRNALDKYGNDIKSIIDKLLPGVGGLTGSISNLITAISGLDYHKTQEAGEHLKSAFDNLNEAIHKFKGTEILEKSLAGWGMTFDHLLGPSIEKVGKAFDSAWKAVSGFVGKGLNKAAGAMMPIIDIAGMAASTNAATGAAFAAASTFISAGGLAVASALIEVGVIIVEALIGWVKELESIALETFNKIKDIAVDVWNKTKDVVVDIATKTWGTIKNVTDELIQSFRGLIEQTESYQRIQSALSTIQEKVFTILLGFLAPIAAVLEKFIGIIDETSESMSSLNVPTGYKVERAAWKAATPGEPGVAKGEGDTFPWLTDLLEEFGDEIAAVAALFKEFADIMGGLWGELGGAIIPVFIDSLTWFGESLTDLANKVKDTLLPTLVEHLPTIIKGAADFFFGAIIGIANLFVDVLTTVLPNLALFAESIGAIGLQLPEFFLAMSEAITGSINFLLEEGLIPLATNIAENLIPALTEYLPEIITGVADFFFGAISGIANLFVETLLAVLPNVALFSENLSAIGQQLPEFFLAMSEAISPVINTLLEGAFIPLSKFVAETLLPDMEGFLTSFGAWWKADVDPFLKNELFPTLEKWLTAFYEWIKGTFLPFLEKNFMPALKKVWGVVEKEFEELGESLGNLWNTIEEHMPTVIEFLTDFIKKLADKWTGMVEKLDAYLMTKSGDLMGGLKKIWESESLTLWDKLKTSFALGAIAIWDWFKEKLQPLFDALKDLGKALSSWWEVLRPVFSAIVTAFGVSFLAAIKIVTAAIKVLTFIVKAITNVFKLIGNFIIGVINAIISIINLIPFVHIRHIPYMEEGGKVLSEGMAYLHANETVIPAAMTTPLGAAAGGGGTTIDNRIYLNGGLLWSEMRKVNKKEERKKTGSSYGSRAWAQG